MLLTLFAVALAITMHARAASPLAQPAPTAVSAPAAQAASHPGRAGGAARDAAAAPPAHGKEAAPAADLAKAAESAKMANTASAAKVATAAKLAVTAKTEQDQSSNGCDLQPPSPILAPHAYARQTVTRKINNEMRETATLENGVRLEILQSQCVDITSVELIFSLPADGLPGAQERSIELARGAIRRLQTRDSVKQFANLDDFLQRSHALAADHGVRAACNDGSIARPGECSWESLGGFVVSTKRQGKHMRVAVIGYTSV
jgi:hypothetical protein